MYEMILKNDNDPYMLLCGYDKCVTVNNIKILGYMEETEETVTDWLTGHTSTRRIVKYDIVDTDNNEIIRGVEVKDYWWMDDHKYENKHNRIVVCESTEDGDLFAIINSVTKEIELSGIKARRIHNCGKFLVIEKENTYNCTLRLYDTDKKALLDESVDVPESNLVIGDMPKIEWYCTYYAKFEALVSSATKPKHRVPKEYRRRVCYITDKGFEYETDLIRSEYDAKFIRLVYPIREVIDVQYDKYTYAFKIDKIKYHGERDVTYGFWVYKEIRNWHYRNTGGLLIGRRNRETTGKYALACEYLNKVVDLIDSGELEQNAYGEYEYMIDKCDIFTERVGGIAECTE